MCTSIIEIAPADGMAKRGDAWFPLSHSVVSYDHARHAPLYDVITLDFINTGLDAGSARRDRADLGRRQGAARRARPSDRRRGVRGGGSQGPRHRAQSPPGGVTAVVRKYSIGAVLIVGRLNRRKTRQDFDEKPRVAHPPALQARFCKGSRI